jgi:hypothetical protein
MRLEIQEKLTYKSELLAATLRYRNFLNSKDIGDMFALLSFIIMGNANKIASCHYYEIIQKKPLVKKYRWIKDEINLAQNPGPAKPPYPFFLKTFTHYKRIKFITLCAFDSK